MALIVALAGLLWRAERRGMKTALRLARHEETCAERYGEITQGFKDVKEMLSEQNTHSTTNREATAITLSEIQRSVAVLEENRRMRERSEDRG